MDPGYIFRLTPRNQAEVDPTAAGGLYSLYDVRDQIGKGSFATVKRAIERSTGQMKAVKVRCQAMLPINFRKRPR